MIKGLYETHLFVENLERSIDFYANTLGLEQCRLKDDRRIAFFWVGEPKQQMLGLWEKPKDEIDIRHYAFQCEPNWILNESVDFFKKHNLNSWNFLNDGTNRPMVFTWMPALAIYFNDPDGHELEFIGILDGDSKPENGILSYEDWKALEIQNK